MLISKGSDLVTLINVFETTPQQQQALIDQWILFTQEVRKEPGYVATALHKSADGTRMINYAHWRSQANFDNFLKKYGSRFAQFTQNASHLDPHTYEVVYLDELTDR